jgi:hypothetical protein
VILMRTTSTGARPTRPVFAVARPSRIKPKITSRVKPCESRRASVRPSAELARRLSARWRLICITSGPLSRAPGL